MQAAGAEDILVEDIQSLVYSCGVGSCRFVARESNKMAYTLAKLCLREDFLSLSADVIWGYIAKFLADDLI